MRISGTHLYEVSPQVEFVGGVRFVWKHERILSLSLSLSLAAGPYAYRARSLFDNVIRSTTVYTYGFMGSRPVCCDML